jgi:hypothetical protein
MRSAVIIFVALLSTAAFAEEKKHVGTIDPPTRLMLYYFSCYSNLDLGYGIDYDFRIHVMQADNGEKEYKFLFFRFSDKAAKIEDQVLKCQDTAPKNGPVHVTSPITK